MITEIDRKYFERYIIPAAADFISGVGEAIAKTKESTTQTSSSTTTTNNDPKFNEAIAQGISDGFSGLSDAIKESAGAFSADAAGWRRARQLAFYLPNRSLTKPMLNKRVNKRL
jgi:hypothetical protein